MDGKGFQVWHSAARGLTLRAAARGARGAVGPERGRGIEGLPIELGVVEARRCPHCSSEGAVSHRYGAGSAALPVNLLGLRQDLQRAERYAAVGLAPQGTLAVVRGVAGEGGDGEGLGVRRQTWRPSAVSTAFRWRHRFLAGGAKRFGPRRAHRGSWKLVRDLQSWRAGSVRARAGTQGTAAGRQGEEARLSREQVPVLMAADRSGSDGHRCAARGSMRRRSAAALDPGREGRPAGLRRWRELPTLRRRARGASHEAGFNRSIGTNGFGAICMHQTVNSLPQPVEGLPASPRRGIARLSGQRVPRAGSSLVRWPRSAAPMTGPCLAAAVTRLTHTIHVLDEPSFLYAMKPGAPLPLARHSV